MEYDELNLQEKARFLFNKFKEVFDEWDCSIYESKENCKENRLLLKHKYMPHNEKVADEYNKLCDEYAYRVKCK